MPGLLDLPVVLIELIFDKCGEAAREEFCVGVLEEDGEIAYKSGARLYPNMATGFPWPVQRLSDPLAGTLRAPPSTDLRRTAWATDTV